eukprot:191781-Prymnesium_polylepis.1
MTVGAASTEEVAVAGKVASRSRSPQPQGGAMEAGMRVVVTAEVAAVAEEVGEMVVGEVASRGEGWWEAGVGG